MTRVGRLVKESSVTEVSTQLSDRPNFFIASINRLPASEADIFRRKLAASSAKLIMIKRRLSHRALEPLKLSGITELLEGSVGFVLAGDDVLLAAKILVEFQKSHEELMGVQGGVVDGQLLDKSRVKELAGLPSKPVLLALVLSTIESPLADVIFTVERLIGDVAWAAEQAATKKPATEAGTAPTGAVAEGSAEARSARPEPQAPVAPSAAPEAQAAPETPSTSTAPAEPPPPAQGGSDA